jgi:hypothetical protein
MSDGPHKSLPMRKGWRKLAERAANTNFDADEICAAVPEAVTDDWMEEGCDQVVQELREILNDARQGSFFEPKQGDKVEALKDVSSAGFPFRRTIVENVARAAETIADPSAALQAGVESAVAQRIVRGCLQVEEHYLRSGDAAASTIRARIGEGVAKVPLKHLAHHFLNPKAPTSLPQSDKRDGVDDGPPLP